MAVRKQPFQNKINCAELNEYKTVKKQNVDDAALFIFQQFFLSEHIHPYLLKTFFQAFIKFFPLAELNISDPRSDQVNE